MQKASRVLTAAVAMPCVAAAAHGAQQTPLPTLFLSRCPPVCHSSTRTAAKVAWLSHPATLRTPLRLQHATASASAASPTTDATAAEPPASPKDNGGVHIDPSRLPSTIPGISQEELAARIADYHSKKAKEASDMSSQALTQEVELMRRSLSPDGFETYMTKLEKDLAAASREQAKLAAMSPVELHHYQLKKKRQAVRYEWYKTLLMVFALLGSTALLFSMFLFFY